MRCINTTAVLVLVTLLFVSNNLAQQTPTTSVPNLIRYSGTLRDAQGAALVSAAPIGVTFAIYNQQDGGAAVWQETQNVTADANGQYSVILGSATAAGLPSDLFSQQEQRWLGVQVQGEAEQARVLLVSVPYAFKAHEAETLGGMSVSDFVLANGASSTANGSTAGQASPSPANNSSANTAGINKGAASAGPTNFSGSTTDQIVGVMQSGSGVGVNASAPSKGVVGTATATSGTVIGVEGGSAGSGGYGVYGNVSSPTGATVGVKGNSQSSAGTGVRGTNIATSGATTGVSGYVASAAGIAGAFNNAAGGKILSGQKNGVEKFSVDGSGNVNATGTFTGNGSGLTSIGFSNLSGTLSSSQFSGSYSNAVTLSNTSNIYYGNGANLTGIIAQIGPGSPYYIQNGTAEQSSADFNIDGDGVLGGSLTASSLNVSGDGTVTGTLTAPGIVSTGFINGGELVNIDLNTGLLGLGGFFDGAADEILDMGDRSSGLLKLRPVSFYYKPGYAHGTHQLQYGLVAEEVAQVYPELVSYRKGHPYTVRYQLLEPMLLNELQKQHAVVSAQQNVIKSQQERVNVQQQQMQAQQQQIEQLQQRLSRLESLIANK